MKRKSEQEIMIAVRPSDIFTMDSSIIEEEKDEYVKRFKPKEFRTVENFIVTKKVLLLYGQAIAQLKGDETWREEEYKKVCITSVEGEKYNINYIEHSEFSLGELYVTKRYIIYVVYNKYKKYYENYIQKTKRYSKPDRKTWKMVQYALPKVEKYFENTDNNFVIFVKKPSEMYSLREILEYFDGSLNPEYVASILTRLYYFVCYIGLIEMTHNAITLDNLYFAPGKEVEEGSSYTVDDMRIVGVYGGWFFTTYLEEKIIGMPKEVYEILPEKCKNRGFSSFEVDMLSIKEVAKKLLGNKICETPKPFFDWVNSKKIAENAYLEFCDWERVVDSSFGGHRFVDIDISI